MGNKLPILPRLLTEYRDVDSKRDELIRLLIEMSEIRPSMRFGQLVVNLAQWAKGPVRDATWEVTDEELILAAKNHIERHRTTGA